MTFSHVPGSRAVLLGAIVTMTLSLCSMTSNATRCHAQATLPDGFSDELVEAGLTGPVGLAFLPDGRLFFIEQNTGSIRLLVNDALAAIDPVCTVPNVTTGNERGSVGIAVDPEWPARPYVYVHSTATGNVIRVSRFKATGDLDFTGDGSLSISTTSRFDLINNIPDANSNHNGGSVRFGNDGMLYVSLGEDNVRAGAQDTSSLRGVILRLQVSHLGDTTGAGPAARAQITPPDNPFSTVGGLNARLVWHWGLRNPFRIQFDRGTGDLFIADVGQAAWEEVDWATTGGLNFGWSRFEGFTTFNAAAPMVGTHTPPIYVISHSEGVGAIVMAGVYRRPAGATRGFPLEYEGSLFVSDYYEGMMRRLVRDGSSWSLAPEVPGQTDDNWATNLSEAADYAIGPDGALYYARQTDGGFSGPGQIRRIVPSSELGVPDSGVDGVVFRAPYPSPSSGRVEFEFTLPAPARVKLAIHDVRGRLVRTLVDRAEEPAGRRHARWDGRDDDGRALRSGVYFARLDVGGRSFERRVPLIR